jgi:hypothetical protein
MTETFASRARIVKESRERIGRVRSRCDAFRPSALELVTVAD